MRLNPNLILNQKYNLKSIVRKTNDSVALCDLNTKLLLGLNLPSSNVFSNIQLINYNLSFKSHALKWKLLALNTRNFLKDDLYLINLKSSNVSFLFGNVTNKRRKNINLIGLSGKSVIRKGGLQKLVLINKFLSKSPVANKILLIGLHNENKNIIQNVYSEQIRTKFTPFYDKTIRKTKLEKINDNFLFSSSFLNNSLKNNNIKDQSVTLSQQIIEKFLKYVVKNQNDQSSYKKGHKYEDKKSSYYQNLMVATLINNKLINKSNVLSKNVNSKENLKIELIKKLSDESQFKIKEAFKILYSEIFRQNFFKKTKESYNQHLSNSRYNSYKRYKTLYKAEIKSFKRINNVRFQKAISSFFQKFRFNQRKSKFGSNLKIPFKIKISKK